MDTITILRRAFWKFIDNEMSLSELDELCKHYESDQTNLPFNEEVII